MRNYTVSLNLKKPYEIPVRGEVRDVPLGTHAEHPLGA